MPDVITTYFVEWVLTNVFDVPRNHIVYLVDTSDPGFSYGWYPYCDYNDSATKANVRYYIGTWLASKTGNTFIYFCSHGGGYNPTTGTLEYGRYDTGDGNEFCLPNGTWVGVDECIYLSSLTPAEYYWDDEFQQDLSNFNSHPTIVIDACKNINDTGSGLTCFSGGFIEDLSGPYRTIITSSNETGVSYFSGGISDFTYWLMNAFSTYNIVGIGYSTHFDSSFVNWGYNTTWIGAFEYALQNDPFYMKPGKPEEFPWFDDDGNGLPGWVNNQQVLDFPYNETALWRWLHGDINMDGVVNMKDIAIIAHALTSEGKDIVGITLPGMSNWNRQADVAPGGGDGVIFLDDLLLVCFNFGKTITGG